MTINQRGFTMVELMITLVILGLSSVFIYQIFITQHDSYMAQQDVSETQQDVRASLDLMTRDLRSVGFGVPGGGTGITTTSNNAFNGTDAITFSTSQTGATAASTYLTADATGTGIDVNSATGFTANTKVNLINALDRSQLGSALYTITSVSGTAHLVLDSAPTAKQGDLVVSVNNGTAAVQSIQYSLANDLNNPGTYLLQRCVWNGVGACPASATDTLADHVLDLQIQYTLLGGGADVDTVTSANLNNIRMVKVTLTTQTVKNLAKAGSGSESGYRLGQRSLTAFVRIKNT